jgi:hypothetical protein
MHLADVMIISQKMVVTDRFLFRFKIFLALKFFLGAERNLEDNYRLEPIYHITCKILVRVKNGKTFTKRGNVNKNLLNGVISVKNVKLGGKNWNSVYKKFTCLKVTSFTIFRFILHFLKINIYDFRIF